MEVGKTIFSLDFINSQLDLSEGMIFIVLEVGEGDFEDSAFQGVVGIFQTSCAVDQGFPNSEIDQYCPSVDFDTGIITLGY